MRRNTLHSRRHALGRGDSQAGLTLVEILVSLIVVSMGLLGVVALQMRTLKNSYVALMRSQASALADDIADRMRANRAAVVKDGLYDQVAFGATPAAGTTQAAVDVRDWKGALSVQLPSGDGEIDVATNGVVTIRVRWGERAEKTGDPTTLTFVTETVI